MRPITKDEFKSVINRIKDDPDDIDDFAKALAFDYKRYSVMQKVNIALGIMVFIFAFLGAIFGGYPR